MSSAGISFGGLASGLDTQAIISALVAVQQRPILGLEAKQSSIQQQKSLFGDLDTLLDKLTSKAQLLKTTSDFLQMTAASDEEGIATATASSSATPGSYSLTVDKLASSQVNAVGQASASNVIQAGTASLQIDAGGSSYLISVQDASLDSIAAAINSENQANDIGVRAEVIDTGNTTTPAERYQLVLRADDTGSAGAFTVSVDDGNAAFTTVINDLQANVEVAAQDAQLTVDGITVYRQSNTVSDLFSGLTLELKSESATEVTITVATDGAETSTKVKEFVDAYNEVVDFFSAQSVVDESGNSSSPLFGDSTLRSMRSGMRSIVGSQVTTSGNDAYQMLVQIGITSDTEGKLTFNQGAFEEALAADEDAVSAVFADATNGIAARLETTIDLYTDSVDGLIKTRTDGFDRLVKQMKDRIESAERRLEQYEQQLTTRYANLETLLGRLQSQGNAAAGLGQ